MTENNENTDFEIMASEIGFEIGNDLPNDILIRCDREPVTEEEWVFISDFVKENFPLSPDDISHGFSPDSCKVYLPAEAEAEATGKPLDTADDADSDFDIDDLVALGDHYDS